MGIIVVLAILVMGGAICGFIALYQIWKLKNELFVLQADLGKLRQHIVKEATPRPAPPPPSPVIEPRGLKPIPPMKQPPGELPAVEAAPQWTIASLESFLGLKTIAYVGAVMLLIGMALGMKYVYDVWLDPVGRLALGVMLSTIALGLGEYFRRREWTILFQALTGIAIAGYYLNVFFSFQVYHLISGAIPMLLAVAVTFLAIALAVAHDAIAIALFAALGGFLSPVLLSTGENHPYALFIYISILDMLALGAAYFRRWRILDAFCFAGTAVIYTGWFLKFYNAGQLAPGMLFASIFYLVFLVVPLLNNYVRRREMEYEGLALVTANAAFTLGAFYFMLFAQHRQLLGFIAIGQALLLFLLFRIWNHRMGKTSLTGQNLLLICLALALIAAPIQLKLYALALIWAMEGVLLCWVGVRYGQVLPRMAGLAGLALSIFDLLKQTPLHKALFIPIWNVPFGSWLFVIAAVVLAAYVYRKLEVEAFEQERLLCVPMILIAFGMLCVLLSWETFYFWQMRYQFLDKELHKFFQIHQATSLIVLWAAISALTALAVKRVNIKWAPLAWGVYAVGGIIFLVGISYQPRYEAILALNVIFLPRLLFVASAYFGAYTLKEAEPEWTAHAIELAGHALIAILGGLEIYRWSTVSEVVSRWFGLSMVSAYWAALACLLVWLGLVTRNQPRRIAGFVLFGVTIGKVILADTYSLARVYQVLSWLACGVLLLIAAVLYHRYSSTLLAEEPKEKA